METLKHKHQLRLINEAVYNTHLTINERKFYKWMVTQNRHKHLIFISPRWNYNWLTINQKRKR